MARLIRNFVTQHQSIYIMEEQAINFPEPRLNGALLVNSLYFFWTPRVPSWSLSWMFGLESLGFSPTNNNT